MNHADKPRQGDGHGDRVEGVNGQPTPASQQEIGPKGWRKEHEGREEWLFTNLGFAIVESHDGELEDHFAYTMGLNLGGVPELVLFGVPKEAAYMLLSALALRTIQGEVALHPCPEAVWELEDGSIFLVPMEDAERHLVFVKSFDGPQSEGNARRVMFGGDGPSGLQVAPSALLGSAVPSAAWETEA